MDNLLDNLPDDLIFIILNLLDKDVIKLHKIYPTNKAINEHITPTGI